MYGATEIQEDTSTSPRLSDGAKLGIIGGVLGLTAIIAHGYREGGWISKKMAKGTPDFPVGGAAWNDWMAQHRAAGPGTYTSIGNESVHDIAAKLGGAVRPYWTLELRDANPGWTWNDYLAPGETINIPGEWLGA